MQFLLSKTYGLEHMHKISILLETRAHSHSSTESTQSNQHKTTKLKSKCWFIYLDAGEFRRHQLNISKTVAFLFSIFCFVQNFNLINIHLSTNQILFITFVFITRLFELLIFSFNRFFYKNIHSNWK